MRFLWMRSRQVSAWRKVLMAGLVLAVAATSQAAGWSGPGHAAVAVLAYRELADDSELRDNLVELLHSHPAFKRWQQEYESVEADLPAGVNFGTFLFVRAATWPDEIRRTKNKKLKPFDHPNWHYVDYPLTLPDFAMGSRPDPTDDVLFGIEASLETLADGDADAVQRAAALSWLIHLIGDLHQPLHCAELFSQQFKNGDTGGNEFLIFQNKEHQQAGETTKLHSFWDGRQFGSKLVPDPGQALTDSWLLSSRHPRSSLDELDAGDSPERWSFESRDLAISDVYQFKGKTLRTWRIVPKGYVSNSHRVAARRLALAGYRLADEIKKTEF